MNYKFYLLPVLAVCFLCGCISSPRVLSQGATSNLMPHIPRAPGAEKSEQAIGAQITATIPSEGMNMEQDFAIGGNLSYLYQGLLAKPLFAEITLGSFYGQGEFACQEKCHVSKLVEKSWEVIEGESMDYWSLQQRLRLGAEFGNDLIFGGLSLGAQFHENFGEMEDARRDLVKLNAARGDEDFWNITFHMNYFLGFHLGRYGSVTVEDAMNYAYDLDSDEFFVHTLSLTYIHPDKYFGGVAFSENGMSIGIGKVFTF